MNKVKTIQATDEYRSSLFAGYHLPSAMIDGLVDEGFETIVFLDPNRGRYVSTLDDWLDYGVERDGDIHLRQSRMG